jgi:hypothetical protein
MEESSMLLEHTLLTSGETAEAGHVYVGWPARQIDANAWRDGKIVDDKEEETPTGARIICAKCQEFPRGPTGKLGCSDPACGSSLTIVPTVTSCGHLFCASCIERALASRKVCPVCFAASSPKDLRKIYPTFVV